MSNSSDHNKSLSQVTNLTANTGRSEPLNTAEKPIAEALNHSQSTFHSISLLPSISTDFASVAGRNEEIEHSEKTPLTPKTRMNGGQPITHTKSDDLLQNKFPAIDRSVDKHTFDPSKQIRSGLLVELKNTINQRSDSSETELRSLQFISEQLTSLLNHLTPLGNTSNSLLLSLRNSESRSYDIETSNKKTISLSKDKVVSQTDISLLSKHVKEFIDSNHKLQPNLDNLFSLVHDKLDLFNKSIQTSLASNAIHCTDSYSNLLGASNLSNENSNALLKNSGRHTIVDNNSKRGEKKDRSNSRCHNNFNSPDNEMTGAVLMIGNDVVVYIGCRTKADLLT
ncbi:hypothetical protein MJO28_014903 [Puccinia striiformis f. sp. tritici]|uniref:Uncharacterized protein n=3 Tax=Puccinia striiformis TaxID=27350 RepID=A0A2S4UH88_9BASI|nr:hypothetical protein MJO28_014903 [Puccinia striiformis f. sp. tritici]POV96662.1 hypothetical protein PSTT_15513 [Puccinia striiformis]POW03834.1 hypothetical protein PSHT_11466 [Puccinia striiformis]